MSAAPVFKPVIMADVCRTSFPTLFNSKTTHPFLPIPSKPIKLLHLSSSSSSPSPRSWVSFNKISSPSIRSVIALVAQTSDWARQEEESDVGEAGFDWEQQQGEKTEASLSQWEGEGPEHPESSGEEREESSGDGFTGESEEDSYPLPPEEAKLFVGNLAYDMDHQSLAELFDQAGTVEVAEDVNGRLLTVNKAAPRGSRVERSPRLFEPSFRIYVGNLPWQVDDARLEQVFSEHGKVVDLRVVYERETGRSRGFGFVTMSTQTELDDAIAALGQNLDGRAIRVNVAEERPRRAF